MAYIATGRQHASVFHAPPTAKQMWVSRQSVLQRTTGTRGLLRTPTALLRGEPVSHRWSANYLTSRTPYGRLATHED